MTYVVRRGTIAAGALSNPAAPAIPAEATLQYVTIIARGAGVLHEIEHQAGVARRCARRTRDWARGCRDDADRFRFGHDDGHAGASPLARSRLSHAGHDV